MQADQSPWIRTQASVLSGKKEVFQAPTPVAEKTPHALEKDQKGLTFVYPYGATLNVKKPSAPILSTGFISYPVNRPVAAVWQEGGVSAPSTAVKSGRLAVVGSAQCFSDEYLDKEENSKLQEVCVCVYSRLLPPHPLTSDLVVSV